MKLLSKKISQISKLVLLYSLLIGGTYASELVSSDRFLFKIIDRTISIQDITYQLRNLRSLHCVYSDAFIIQYFDKDFLKNLHEFVRDFPSSDEEVRRFMNQKESKLKQIRFLFKMLRYSEDQKEEISPQLSKLLIAGIKENKCGDDVLHKDGLRTNFIELIELELYLRARYGEQIKQNQKFDVIRPSIELFVESLDKQFAHEYYW